MGRCKQLLPLDSQTVIARCLETLLTAGLDEVIVVVGPHGEEVGRAARAYPVRVVVNTDPEADMAASLRRGRQALSHGITGVVVALCDYPLVTAETVAQLVAEHRRGPRKILIPCHNGRRGHPPLVPRQVLDSLTAPLTLRDVLRENQQQVEHVPVDDGGVLLDMDTPEDYRRVLKFHQLSQESSTLLHRD